MKIEVVMGLIMMLLVNHIIACLWYGIGSWSLGKGLYLGETRVCEKISEICEGNGRKGDEGG